MRYIFGLVFILILSVNARSQTGTWHANSNGWPVTITIAAQGDRYIGYMSASDNECNQKLDNVTWDAGVLEFRHTAPGVTQWYRVTIADGLMVGRFSHENATKAGKPTELLAYKGHVTGWSEEYFSATTPIVFDIDANGFRGRLRIDKSGNQFVGRLKMYAFENAAQEYAEEEIGITHWDGEALTFTRGSQVYTGDVDRRYISGIYTRANGSSSSWSGRRAEVLTYGITQKSPEDRMAWQERTRRALYRLMMAGNPDPASVSVEVLADNLPPVSGGLYPHRDDDPSSYPQNYTLTELRLTYTVGAAPRVVHAYLAKPTTPPPGNLDRYPLVVALNGHLGSAHKVMDSGSLYWYGDAWARRGYMVLAVDIGHRPSSDVVRARYASDLSTYLGYPDDAYQGDDVAHGNGLRASIKPAKPEGYSDVDWAYATDWEEDGERVYDVMRAIDYAVSRSDVDSGRIVVTGLSLGAEIASYVGALDTRVSVTIPASYSPDWSVVKYLRQVGHCWAWSFADNREYLSQSDVLALIAPRPLIVQTGIADSTYSNFPQYALPGVPVGSAPFAGDKQVVRRARVAYGPDPLFHFLHPLGHEYRTGPVSYTTNDEQLNTDTAGDGRTLFDYVRQFLSF